MQLRAGGTDLNLAHAFSSTRRWEAYERLLLDVIEGDSTLFIRRDEWKPPELGRPDLARLEQLLPQTTALRRRRDGPEQATSSSNGKATAGGNERFS